jgi:uncharacterized membrane protein YfcA
VYNLLMGLPLKFAVASSGLTISVVDTAAAWVYINSGGLIPLLVVPAMAGVMLGSAIGVRLLPHAPVKLIRWVVVALLICAGLRSLLKGLGIW